MKLMLAAAAFSLLAPFALAKNGNAAGHWQGSISLPDRALMIDVDLALEKDGWKGAITIPEQNLQAFPLSSIEVVKDTVKFSMQGVPGYPAFTGKLAPGDQSISGNFSQGGATVPFSLKRSGEAQFPPVDKSTLISKEIEGAWVGVLETGVTGRLQVVLRLTNQKDAATGTLTSVNQGGAVVPIAVIVQKGSTLTLELPSVNASFVGEVSPDATSISGKWTQAMGTLPLVFHRPPAAAK